MVSLMQIWWQMRQAWSFVRYAYSSGLSLYANAPEQRPQRRYAMAYAVTQVTPRSYSHL